MQMQNHEITIIFVFFLFRCQGERSKRQRWFFKLLNIRVGTAAVIWTVHFNMEIWCGTTKDEAVQRALYELWWLIFAISFCLVAAK